MIVSAMLNSELSYLSNKIQIKRSEQLKNERIDYLDYFLLESVKEKLDKYNISNISDIQALTDIIIMIYIHFAKIKTLYISNKGIIRYAKN